MALSAIMVDRCRVVRNVKTGQKIDGRPQTGEEKSPWIRCRIETFGESERSDEGHWRRVTSTRLMMLTKDTTGRPIDIKATDVLEVTSRAFGEATWQVDGNPEHVRKRSGPAFFMRVRIRRVQDSGDDEVS